MVDNDSSQPIELNNAEMLILRRVMKTDSRLDELEKRLHEQAHLLAMLAEVAPARTVNYHEPVCTPAPSEPDEWFGMDSHSRELQRGDMVAHLAQINYGTMAVYYVDGSFDSAGFIRLRSADGFRHAQPGDLVLLVRP